MDKITIVAASDNHYAVLLSVLLKSLEVNHITPELLDVYVMDDGISDANKRRIKESLSEEKTCLHWIDKKDAVPAEVKLPLDKSAFPLTTYLRLFAPYVIPSDARKMIYLDVDMLVLKDISSLWNTEMGGYTLAAVTDLGETVSCEWGGIPNYKQLGIPATSKYFNAGLLVVDPVKWRADSVAYKVLQIMENNRDFANYADQYGLNVAMANNWLELDRNWNCFAALEYPDPYIIHFLDIKPIYKSYRSNGKFKEEFFKYLHLTSWKDLKPQSDYKRLWRKVLNKSKKRLSNILRSL